ncbi:tail fiber protein [Pseudomonas citronellolis]|uniref:phage tail protein n=1 Tax=Pseudomonas citronellolis TaxID=53408 RepID=UPI000E2E85C1|nr:tail fiber protein [Pseudomonas citronellolis]MDN6873842.1 tail fiber protein [Pseudomonas citronellolis]
MSDPFLGEIKMFGGNFAPRGYALCYGQTMSIAQNAALFSILGVTYGGNGVQTFALPDLRGRSPVGFGQQPGLSPVDLGQVGGGEAITLTINNLPAHAHTVTGTASVSIPVATTEGTSMSPSNTSVLATTVDNTAGAEVKVYAQAPGSTTLAPFNASVTGQTASVGNNMPVAIRNPFQGINFIIALEGIFPSRN